MIRRPASSDALAQEAPKVVSQQIWKLQTDQITAMVCRRSGYAD
jgi:hypothetical protein